MSGLPLHSSAHSFVASLLRPQQHPDTQKINLETMQILKEKLASASGSSHSAASACASSASAPSSTSSSSVTPLHLPSFTWPHFLHTLPPSAQAASSPDVQSLKSSFSGFLSSVASLVDDERDSAALAETAAILYKHFHALTQREEGAKEKARKEAENSGTAAPSPSDLSSTLKSLTVEERTKVERQLGRLPERGYQQCWKQARLIMQQAKQMHDKYEMTKIKRQLNRLGKEEQQQASSGKEDKTLFIAAPRTALAAEDTLLEQEFGADLPIMHSIADEQQQQATAEEDDEEEDGGMFFGMGDEEEEQQPQADKDDPVLACSQLATRPVEEMIRQLKASLRSMGIQPPKSLRSSSPPSLPSGSSSTESDTDSSSFSSDDDELSDVYVGESDEDESLLAHHKLTERASQPARALHAEPLQGPTYCSAPLLTSTQLPTHPEAWWLWLVQQCDALVTYTDDGVPAVSNQELAQQVLSILQASKADVESDLLDLIGFERLDLLAVLVKERAAIRQITSQHQATARQSQQEREALQAEQTHKTRDGTVVRGLVGVSIQSTTDIAMHKNRKKNDRLFARRSARAAGDGGAGADSKTQIDEAKLDAQASALKPWISASGASHSISQLPEGTKRTVHKGYEEVIIPPPKTREVNEKDLVAIDKAFPPFAQAAFPRTKTLNRIQSKVYQAAYHHNNNLLIAAPTGAGKTNVAMMCVLREIGQHIVDGVLRKDMFKMVYVAPMKALAQEVQSTFQKRLAPLGIQVKELTGDMQLTKKELAETQLIVTTPEKWDVITRKSGSDSGGSGGGGGGNSLMSLVKLLIIDECHLLNEDRGPVLEILVARTLRMVESSQQMCRIVGLSATLPNYKDVAVFLRAQERTGLFFFDSSYRPVPLTQTFIGVTETNSVKRLQSMNELTYKKALEHVRVGYQVMVFVHSRRDTVKTAKFIKEQAGLEGTLPLFDCSVDSPQHTLMMKKVAKSRNSELMELFPYGFAMHHAGMIRSDRALVEAAFAAGLIKCLVCTATLAWGVNLPTHAVILKGTQIYNAEKGGFESVSMLDVLQIFGRAGRPQFDDHGEAIMIMEHDKLPRYLGFLTQALPIESQFIKELPNHLNAEIILGTITTLHEAIQWLSYTYLYVRMLRNPMSYGISYDELQFDELLIQRRTTLILDATKTLMRCRMIKFDQSSGQFYSTDVGRVASHYYLHYESVELYNQLLTPVMSDEDILHLLASSKEFAQIQTREEEISELEKLMGKYVPIKIKGEMGGATGKQNLLLQVYISNGLVESPTLISDSYFIHQSAGRICRALFEMVLKRGRAYLTSKFLTFAQMIERKIWHFQTPLRQFLTAPQLGPNSNQRHNDTHGGLLKMSTIMRLEERNLKLEQLVEMSAAEIGAILKHEKMGAVVKQCVSYIPWIGVEAKVQPITRRVLRIDMELQAEFTWSDRHHGSMESFWVWIEDTNNEHIYHSEQFLLHKQQLHEVHKLSFTIPTQEPLPPQIYIKVVSDRWLGSENVIALSFQHLILPELHPNHTELLDLHPLPRSALANPAYERMYAHKFDYFNPVQTQIFHTLYHTDENVLLGAPTGSGKTIVAELSMLRLFSVYPGTKVVYIAPLKALARERIEDWSSSKSFSGMLNKRIVELTGDTAPDARAINSSDIIITTPEKWDGISRHWSSRSFVRQVGLVIIDEIHLLGADRGPVLEVIVSRMRYISSHTASNIRIVGLSTALSNARDLGDWLGIERAGLFNFPPSVRPVPLTIHMAGFAGRHYCPRMNSMNRPTYAAIQTHSPTKPVLVFVSSRRQTRLTALDLIAFSAADGNPRKWLRMSESQLQQVLPHVTDPNLKHMLSFGIGMHHAGLATRDRLIVEKLFLEHKIQVLVCTSTLAWGVNFPCHLVVVKGTEYYDAKKRGYVQFPITDVLQMIGRAGRPQFDTEAKAVVLVHEPLKNFYLNFLHSPFPVESSLMSQMHDHVNAEICASGTIKSVGDLLDWISWTFFFRRLLKNPSYYGLEGVAPDQLNAFLMRLCVGILGDLERAGLIAQQQQGHKLEPLPLGKISAYYYLKYTTISVFTQRLRPDISLPGLLETLAHASEYEELPVRHNEDKLNLELVPAMRWKIDTSSLDSPHTKAHILFQAHLSRLDLPISDYWTDLKSVLDQCIRILQAMVDTTAEAGWTRATLATMQLMQMIVQGRWREDSPLMNLPGVQNNDRLLDALHKEGFGSDMQKLLRADRNQIAQLYRKCKASEKEVTAVMEMLPRLPMVAVQLATSTEEDAGSSSSAKSSPTTPLSFNRGSSSSSSSSSSVPTLIFPSGSRFTLHVDLHRRNSNNNIKIFTPVFAKEKDEAWWLLLGCGAEQSKGAEGAVRQGELALPPPTHDLLSIQRINSLRGKQSLQLHVELPPTVDTQLYTVYLVSDSYIGFDQQFSFRVHTT